MTLIINQNDYLQSYPYQFMWLKPTAMDTVAIHCRQFQLTFESASFRLRIHLLMSELSCFLLDLYYHLTRDGEYFYKTHYKFSKKIVSIHN